MSDMTGVDRGVGRGVGRDLMCRVVDGYWGYWRSVKRSYWVLICVVDVNQTKPWRSRFFEFPGPIQEGFSLSSGYFM